MKNKIVYLGIILTVILSGCGKKTADKDNHLSYDNSENIEADGGSEVHNDNQNVFLKEEADEWNVLEENTKETIYSLDDRLQNVLQVYQNEGKTKVLAVNEENSIFLYNITDDKLYSYHLDKNKNSDWDNYKIISYDNDIIISVDITKMNISEKKEADGVEIIAGNVLDEKKRIYVFDQEMKLKEKYNISNTSETITALTLAGKKGFLAFNNGNIYYYSLKNGIGKILSHKILKKLKDITIDEMQINESQNIIAFLGCKLNQNKYDVYGWIDLVNKTVEIRYTETSYGNNLHMEKDIAYITDGEIPRRHMASGLLKCMNLSSKKFFDFKVENLESMEAYLSKDGSHVFTYRKILSEDKDRITGYLLRIYNFSNGKILYESKWKDKGNIKGIYSCGNGFYVFAENELCYIEI